jgi:hypothetical protein
MNAKKVTWKIKKRNTLYNLNDLFPGIPPIKLKYESFSTTEKLNQI